jgi:hypothetical protein
MGCDDTPGIYVFSARCCGLKGAISGARHSWMSVLYRQEWSTVEVTDRETLSLQTDAAGARAAWVCYDSSYSGLQQRGPFRSNRVPDADWFGQEPKLEAMIASTSLAACLVDRIDHDCSRYPFKGDYGLLQNNCNRFLSFMLWRLGTAARQPDLLSPARRLIGFRDQDYWQAQVRPAVWAVTSVRSER